MKKLIIVLLGVLLLLPYSVSAADLKYGMKNNEEVRQMQQFLKDQGYFKSDVTGNFYSITLGAVKKFQKDNKLKVTGIWNQISQDKMNELVVVPEVSPAPVVDSWVPSYPAPTVPAVVNVPSSMGYCNSCGFGGSVSQPVQPVSTVIVNSQNNNSNTSMTNLIEPLITISKKNLYDNDELSIIALNDDFALEAFTIIGTSKDTKNKISLNSYAIYNSENEENLYKNIFTNVSHFNIGDCKITNNNFKEFSNKEYPYACTGKDYSIEQYNDENLPFGFTFSSVDWMGRQRLEVIAEKGRRSALFIPKSTIVEYMKFVGKSSGKVFEFRNI